jgi:hypothetical protein
MLHLGMRRRLVTFGERCWAGLWRAGEVARRAEKCAEIQGLAHTLGVPLGPRDGLSQQSGPAVAGKVDNQI